jgi:RNAse (barnase) inhibitor barstar
VVRLSPGLEIVTGGDVIADDQQLQTTLERITWFQNHVVHLRKTEKNPVNYRAAVSGLMAEIDRMQLKVREYFGFLPSESVGASMRKATYEIDGNDFSTLEEFYAEISRVLIPGASWGHNLDAFNDILRGGFGTPEEGFILRWKNSRLSRERLGYPETVQQLQMCLGRCHPTNRPWVLEELEIARIGVGPTVFDWLVEIIQIHCPGGREEGDGVELVLD